MRVKLFTTWLVGLIALLVIVGVLWMFIEREKPPANAQTVGEAISEHAAAADAGDEDSTPRFGMDDLLGALGLPAETLESYGIELRDAETVRREQLIDSLQQAVLAGQLSAPEADVVLHAFDDGLVVPATGNSQLPARSSN